MTGATTTLDLPDPQVLTPLALTPREVRGGDPEPVPAGVVALGGPLWAPLPPGYDPGDPELATFREDPTYRWLVGVLSLSVDEDGAAGDRFERVWLKVEMTPADAAAPEPVAWSMKPDKVAQDVQRTTSLTLGPKMQIAGLGVDAAVERGTSRTLQDVSVDALDELTSAPRWVLRRTRSARLNGQTRLGLVVRAPRGTPVTCAVDVGYVTSTRRAVFFWPEQDPQRVATRTATLPEV